MPARTPKRVPNTDTPPEQPSHAPLQPTEGPRITVFDYSEQDCREWHPTSSLECVPPPDTISVRWINVDGIFDTRLVEEIGTRFGLSPLTIEDITTKDQQPKAEIHPEHGIIVVRMFRFAGLNHEIITEQVSIVFGPKFVLTFQEIEGDVFDPVRRRILDAGGRIRKGGSDYLAYSLVDVIVDYYFVILDEMSNMIETAQERLITNPSGDVLREIYQIKRRVLELRRYTWPAREVVLRMEREGGQLFKKTTLPYLRDLYDHIIQVTDHIEIHREWLSSMLDIYLSSVTNRLNEVIKVLTVVSTIAIPPTLIGSWYGMNFKFMPELNNYYFYPVLMIVTAAISVAMLLMFRRRQWI